jgi:RNA polymerase sigma factor (TIGR02999 family)
MGAWFAGEEYAALRRLAATRLRDESPDHTLQATALVHEVFLRLSPQERAHCSCPDQFLALASQAMRRILVDHARAKRTHKRSPLGERVAMEDAERTLGALGAMGVDVEALDAALTKLHALCPRQARVVELRFFGGLALEHVASLLDVSVATVKGDWRVARAWLRRELIGGAP